ncbi:uncharacterized protein LOC106392524 [Brassica napus]|uniref:uncharacterized protein LOC106392524 n=1 Tax=Brassica napus TaxID=3708 RepID=UPI0006AA5D4D|nr:uncharacterized protein LOC106392524 [Brassica napus]
MDKTWIWLPRNSHEYSEGATNFLNLSARRLGSLSEMLCRCRDCRNLSHHSLDKIVEHLVIRGMDKKYKSSCWSIHGQNKYSAEDIVVQYETEAFDLFKTTFSMDEGGPNQRTDNGVETNEDDEALEETEFRKKLSDAQTPLYSDCIKHTKVLAIMGLYRFKVKSGVSENYFDQLLVLLEDLLPEANVLPKSLAAIKKFLKIFGFGYDNIHACKNDCILYRKEYENLESCPRCKVSRWKMDKHNNEIKVGIPAKVLRYFPIKDRFRRMFRSKRMAEDLRRHYTNAAEDGTMRHPVDSISWAQVNDKWPDFAADPRNLRLGISTDGMNPFSMQNTNHSTCPVLLVNYNTPPTMCIKAENIMFTLLIPGTTAPCNNIDVYLAPLIDDLKYLWAEGIEVYDSFAKEYFKLRALLLWSISDYPALGTLSGCKVKGKQACNVCGKDTPARWLKFSRKFVYMGNRKRLSPGHRYRYKKAWFDNTVEEGNANRIQTGDEIYETLQAFKNDLELPVRHNIDVMHVEKNVSDAILSLLMQSAKSKDGLKSRKDLEDIGIRKHLHTEVRGNKTYLPPAAYWLSKKEKTIFCQRLAKSRGPDGYCGNIANSVSVNPPNIGSLKSHGHHVLVQNLLPAALRGLLHRGPRIAINRLCSYFNRLCQRIIDPEKLISMETEFVETMCQLETFFPPALFDIMFHFPIHLSKEARLGGPIYFRWMYPFERYMKTLKAFVKNYARPEACMVEAYLAGECVAFCLKFLKDSVPVQEAVNHIEDVEAGRMVVEGRPLQKGIEVALPDKDRDIAHRYVLMNMASLDPFLDFTLVNLHMNQAAYLKDPFILPSQAKQVFYSREDDHSNWYVVMRAPPRRYHELETEEDLGGTPLPVQEVDDMGDEASDDDSVYVRDECEGLLVVD